MSIMQIKVLHQMYDLCDLASKALWLLDQSGAWISYGCHVLKFLLHITGFCYTNKPNDIIISSK